MGMTLRDIAHLVRGELLREEDGKVRIEGAARLSHAGPQDLVVIYDQNSLQTAEGQALGALLLPPSLETVQHPALRVAQPRLAFALVLEAFQPASSIPPGIHPTAVIGARVHLGQEVSIGPGVVIEADATLGDRTVIQAGCYVGREARLGEEVRLFPRVTLYERVQLGDRVVIHSGTVIGSDGFGYVLEGDNYRKVPQLGTVRVGSDVEIGANAVIDRATTGATEIGAGTKIDNLVQIAHNVVIGERCIIVAQCGIAGSCSVGDQALLGGQAGVKDHITIGPRAKVGAQSGVSRDIPAEGFYSGYPARPHQEQMRVWAHMRRLPELLRTVRNLEQELAQLQARLTLKEEDETTA